MTRLESLLSRVWQLNLDSPVGFSVDGFKTTYFDWQWPQTSHINLLNLQNRPFKPKVRISIHLHNKKYKFKILDNSIKKSPILGLLSYKTCRQEMLNSIHPSLFYTERMKLAMLAQGIEDHKLSNMWSVRVHRVQFLRTNRNTLLQ